MKVVKGDVFSLDTKVGFGFLQYIEDDQFGVGVVRVLESIKPTNEVLQDDINFPERFTAHFVVTTAFKRKLIQRVGNFSVPENYKIPSKAREKHIIRGEFLGWHIIDTKTLKRELKQQLTAEELKIPFHGHPNDTLLREYLESNWRLENWK